MQLAAVVLGRFSACACFLLKNHHLASAAVVKFVLGTYSLQKASRAETVASEGLSADPSCMNAKTMSSCHLFFFQIPSSM